MVSMFTKCTVCSVGYTTNSILVTKHTTYNYTQDYQFHLIKSQGGLIGTTVYWVREVPPGWLTVHVIPFCEVNEPVQCL